MSLRLINPLPRALNHYESALVGILADAGMTDVEIIHASIESGERTVVARLLSHLRAVVKSRTADSALLLWPSLGYGEVVLDAVLSPDLRVVFHDARPLRRQFGMRRSYGRLVGAAGHLASSDRVLVHSRQAGESLTALGWQPPVFLPLPLARPVRGHTNEQDQPTLLVLGQYKEARDVSLLTELPGFLRAWRLRIVGTRWPNIRGWTVVSQFVDEATFLDEIRHATVVLIPYAEFFQSDVLVRVIENCVPAVTRVHDQTSALLGRDWVGMATTWDPNGVAAAVERARLAAPREIELRARRSREAAVAAWASWVDLL